jgi:hypothetical protein
LPELGGGLGGLQVRLSLRGWCASNIPQGLEFPRCRGGGSHQTRTCIVSSRVAKYDCDVLDGWLGLLCRLLRQPVEAAASKGRGGLNLSTCIGRWGGTLFEASLIAEA